jgi:uncharacterized cupredoxin-like copper-binding protein
MSRTSIAFSLFTTLVSAFISSTALASGAHSGGHHADSNAIGQAGNSSKVTRTIQVDMSDKMRFTPASIKVKQGETIKFMVKNSGKIKHEMVLGTEKDLKDHYEVMKKNPEMEHEDPNMVTVQAGKTAEMIWQFTKAGTVHFACLQPGHYDAGMKGALSVSAKSPQAGAPKSHSSH